MNRRMLALLFLGWLASLGTPGALQAAGINTNVALPVREGGFVYRTQLRFLSASDDPTPLDRDINVYAVPMFSSTVSARARHSLAFFLTSLVRSISQPPARGNRMMPMGSGTSRSWSARPFMRGMRSSAPRGSDFSPASRFPRASQNSALTRPTSFWVVSTPCRTVGTNWTPT